jgi:hypothetical protein
MDRWLFAGAILVAVAVYGIILSRLGVIDAVMEQVYAIDFFTAADTPEVTAADIAEPDEAQRMLQLPTTDWEYQQPQNLSEAESSVRALLALGHKEKLAFGTVLVEPTDLSSTGLESLALDRLKLRAEEFKLIREIDINMAGSPGRRADFVIEMGGLMIRYMATYAVRDDKGYQVLFWCLETDYPEFEPQFLNAVSTWTWPE